ncbi:hypothetical protein ACWIUD_06360 [Helicobacter sp. 23-1044]
MPCVFCSTPKPYFENKTAIILKLRFKINICDGKNENNVDSAKFGRFGEIYDKFCESQNLAQKKSKNAESNVLNSVIARQILIRRSNPRISSLRDLTKSIRGNPYFLI